MPSLHVGWSTWSALALLPLCRRVWLKVLVCLYPFCTIFAIVVTANHWILDAIGGWVVLALGYGASRLLEAITTRRRGVRVPPGLSGNREETPNSLP